MATIDITHTRADGTLVHGTSKGDGTAEALRAHTFRFSRRLGCWYLPHSRDRRANRYRIDGTAEALRADGHTVTITIDEATRRSFAEAEQERAARAADRAERFTARAGHAAANADHLWEESGKGLPPMGEPIKIGHHSEGRHRRALERSQQKARRSLAERDRAGYWANRADAAAHYQEHRTNPGTTLRRIERLEASLRRIQRHLDRYRSLTPENAPNPETLADNIAELERSHTEVSEEIAYWKDVIARAEADGVKVWSRTDFRKGDFVRSGNRWYEVLRVNAKSLTVPGGPDIRPVVTADNRAYSWDDRLPYDKVTGRMSADDMHSRLQQEPTAATR